MDRPWDCLLQRVLTNENRLHSNFCSSHKPIDFFYSNLSLQMRSSKGIHPIYFFTFLSSHLKETELDRCVKQFYPQVKLIHTPLLTCRALSRPAGRALKTIQPQWGRLWGRYSFNCQHAIHYLVDLITQGDRREGNRRRVYSFALCCELRK